MIISTVQNSALDEKSSYCQIRIVGKRVNRGGCRFVARSYRKGSARLSGVRRRDFVLIVGPVAGRPRPAPDDATPYMDFMHCSAVCNQHKDIIIMRFFLCSI